MTYLVKRTPSGWWVIHWDTRRGRQVNDERHQTQEAAEKAARRLNGCAICGQKPHAIECPKYGTEGLIMYYGEPDPEED